MYKWLKIWIWIESTVSNLQKWKDRRQGCSWRLSRWWPENIKNLKRVLKKSMKQSSPKFVKPDLLLHHSVPVLVQKAITFVLDLSKYWSLILFSRFYPISSPSPFNGFAQYSSLFDVFNIHLFRQIHLIGKVFDKESRLGQSWLGEMLPPLSFGEHCEAN